MFFDNRITSINADQLTSKSVPHSAPRIPTNKRRNNIDPKAFLEKLKNQHFNYIRTIESKLHSLEHSTVYKIQEAVRLYESNIYNTEILGKLAHSLDSNYKDFESTLRDNTTNKHNIISSLYDQVSQSIESAYHAIFIDESDESIYNILNIQLIELKSLNINSFNLLINNEVIPHLIQIGYALPEERCSPSIPDERRLTNSQKYLISQLDQIEMNISTIITNTLQSFKNSLDIQFTKFINEQVFFNIIIPIDYTTWSLPSPYWDKGKEIGIYLSSEIGHLLNEYFKNFLSQLTTNPINSANGITKFNCLIDFYKNSLLEEILNIYEKIELYIIPTIIESPYKFSVSSINHLLSVIGEFEENDESEIPSKFEIRSKFYRDIYQPEKIEEIRRFINTDSDIPTESIDEFRNNLHDLFKAEITPYILVDNIDSLNSNNTNIFDSCHTSITILKNLNEKFRPITRETANMFINDVLSRADEVFINMKINVNEQSESIINSLDLMTSINDIFKKEDYTLYLNAFNYLSDRENINFNNIKSLLFEKYSIKCSCDNFLGIDFTIPDTFDIHQEWNNEMKIYIKINRESEEDYSSDYSQNEIIIFNNIEKYINQCFSDKIVDKFIAICEWETAFLNDYLQRAFNRYLEQYFSNILDRYDQEFTPHNAELYQLKLNRKQRHMDKPVEGEKEEE